MVQIAPFDYGNAIQQGTQNALSTLKARQGVRDFKRQGAIREAYQGGASDEEAANVLRKQGYGVAANELTKQSQQRRGRRLKNEVDAMKFVSAAAPMARDQQSWSRVRQKMIDVAGADPNALPEEYNPEFVQALAGQAQEKLNIITKNLPGGRAQDYLQQGGQLQPFGEPYGRYSPSAMQTDEGGGLKASDENAIYRYTAGLYGGAVDPRTGEITGLNPEASRSVQAIATRASQLFSGGQAQTRQQAVTMAAREMGIDITNLEAQEKNKEVADRYVDENLMGQPGPTKERARQSGAQTSPAPRRNQPEGEVIRYDAQGNRID